MCAAACDDGEARRAVREQTAHKVDFIKIWVVERVGVEHQQVGAAAGLDLAAIGQPQHVCGRLRRRGQDLRRTHARLHHQPQLAVRRIRVEVIAYGAVVRTENDGHAHTTRIAAVYRNGLAVDRAALRAGWK